VLGSFVKNKKEDWGGGGGANTRRKTYVFNYFSTIVYN